MNRTTIILGCVCGLMATALLADPAMIVGVAASRAGLGWRFDVTLRHADTGWDHFADAWQVLAPDGTVIATRELTHPHVDEQPFTRSLVDVMVPDGMRIVRVRASCTGGDVSDAVEIALTR